MKLPTYLNVSKNWLIQNMYLARHWVKLNDHSIAQLKALHNSLTLNHPLKFVNTLWFLYVPILEPFKSSLHYLGTGLVFKYNNKISNALVKNNLWCLQDSLFWLWKMLFWWNRQNHWKTTVWTQICFEE